MRFGIALADGASADGLPGWEAEPWGAEPYPQPMAERRGLSVWRILVPCLGLLATAAAATGAWFAVWPTTVVETRIVADGPGLAGRAALAEAALRIGTAPGRSAMLDEYGDALLIKVADEQPAAAWQRARSLTNSLLDLSTTQASSAVIRPSGPERIGPRAALLAERDRLTAIAGATDARAASVSASLTNLTRDIAAGARSVAERNGGRETLDKGASALADLQLQRIQLAGRYLDDYPAVVALDGQIRSLRSFLQDEARRVDAAAKSLPSDPGASTLESERDRLRTELSQLNDRRVAVGTQLAALGRTLATTPLDAAVTSPVVVAATPAPLLIEAATTVASGPDNRWLYVSAVAAVGLVLSLLAWFKPRSQPAADPTEQLLLRLEAVMRSQPASLAAASYPSLSGTQTASLLRSAYPETLRPR
jgi:hypothetical protein